MSEKKAGTALYGAPAPEAAAGSAEKMKGQLGAAADKAKDKIDAAREPIADKLLGAADTLRARSQRLPRRAASVAESAADKLEESATYLVSNNLEQMLQDVRAAIRRHPTRSLAMAGVVGFLIGRAISKD
jgi:ElaB/YqjD/DUF883 family membrane-anchored ribosome-binding protein